MRLAFACCAVVVGCSSGDFTLASENAVQDPIVDHDAAHDATTPGSAHDAALSSDVRPYDAFEPAEDTSITADAGTADADDAAPKDACGGSLIDLATTLVDAKLAASMSRSREHAVTHRMRHDGSIRAITLRLSRQTYDCPEGGSCTSPDPACAYCTSSGSGSCNCSAPAPTSGEVTLDVVLGTPGAGGAVLATSKVSMLAIGTAAKSVRFELVTDALAAGTDVHFRLRTESTAWQLTMYGSTSGVPPASVSWWRRTIHPPGPWYADTVFTPVIAIEVVDCD